MFGAAGYPSVPSWPSYGQSPCASASEDSVGGVDQRRLSGPSEHPVTLESLLV